MESQLQKVLEDVKRLYFDHYAQPISNIDFAHNLSIFKIWFGCCQAVEEFEELRLKVKTIAKDLRDDQKLLIADNYEDLLLEINEKGKDLVKTTLKKNDTS